MPPGAGSRAEKPAISAIDRGMPETVLNLRGLKCPLPALKTRKALTRIAAGDELVVECTDPLAGIDIPNLLRETGDALLDTRKQPDLIVFRIQKK